MSVIIVGSEIVIIREYSISSKIKLQSKNSCGNTAFNTVFIILTITTYEKYCIQF